MINLDEGVTMKRTLFISILALVLGTIVLSGCTPYYAWKDPNEPHTIHLRTYAKTRPMKVLAHRYEGMFYDIGFTDPADPKDPFKLRRTEALFKVQVGHPERFVGRVLYVEVWIDDIGPIRAAKHRDGYYYFKVGTGSRWLHGLEPRVDDLSPGRHKITARTAWEHTRGPYERGPEVEDFVEVVHAWIDYDPWYVR